MILQYLSPDCHGMDAALLLVVKLGEAKYTAGYTAGSAVNYVVAELEAIAGRNDLTELLKEQLGGPAPRI